MTETKKPRAKNSSIYAVSVGGQHVAFVRHTSTTEAKSALPIEVRKLKTDELIALARSDTPILGMDPEPRDPNQLDAFPGELGNVHSITGGGILPQAHAVGRDGSDAGMLIQNENHRATPNHQRPGDDPIK